MHADPVAVKWISMMREGREYALRARFKTSYNRTLFEKSFRLLRRSMITRLSRCSPCLPWISMTTISRDFFFFFWKTGKEKNRRGPFPLCCAKNVHFLLERPHREEYCAPLLLNQGCWLSLCNILYMEWQDIRSLCITPLLTACAFTI